MKQCHNCKIYVSRIINLKGKTYCPTCFKRDDSEDKLNKRRFRWDGLKELYNTKEQLLNHIAVLVVILGVGTGVYMMTHHLLVLGIFTMWASLFAALIPHLLSEIDDEWLHIKNTQSISKIKKIDDKTKELIKQLYKDYKKRFKSFGCHLVMRIVRSKPLYTIENSRWIRDYESVVEIKITKNGKLIEYDKEKLHLVVELVNTNYISVWINKLQEVKKELEHDLEMVYDYVDELYTDGQL